jgi:hypothetical protein
LTVVKLIEKVTALQSSAHTGRALKTVKILNLIGTVRGAITTVLLASSAIGGAVTVNNVRQDIVADKASATATPRQQVAAKTTPPPTPTPLTAAGLRADAERRLRIALDQNAAGVDDLRKISVLGASATDALIQSTRQKLQNRFDLAMQQVDQLLAVPSPAASGTPPPSPSLSVVAGNALVQVAVGDMNGILFVATRQATTEPPPVVVQTPKPTPPPTVAPTPVRTPTPTTQPIRTPSPTVRPSPTR